MVAQFMTQAMEFRPRLFEFASHTLQQENYELAVWALGDLEYVKKSLQLVRNPFLGKFFRMTAGKLQEHIDRANAEIKERFAFEEFHKLVKNAKDEPSSMLDLSPF